MRDIKQEQIKVELIDSMGSDIRVSNVAKVSFNKWDDESLEINDKQVGLLNYLATGLPSSERDDWEARAKASTHWTPYGHCFLSIRVGVPIFLARQLHKHVVGLVINEESRRYITDDVALWFPEVVHKKPSNIKQGASKEIHIDRHISMSYDNHCTALEVIQNSSEGSVENYYSLIEAGVAPEEARMVLPLNSMTHWVWSGSLMAFLRVAKQRSDGHAQGVAQEFAGKLLGILNEKFPESVKAFGFKGENNA
jgi:thymidylate synthase (FAD)